MKNQSTFKDGVKNQVFSLPPNGLSASYILAGWGLVALSRSKHVKQFCSPHFWRGYGWVRLARVCWRHDPAKLVRLSLSERFLFLNFEYSRKGLNPPSPHGAKGFYCLAVWLGFGLVSAWFWLFVLVSACFWLGCFAVSAWFVTESLNPPHPPQTPGSKQKQTLA